MYGYLIKTMKEQSSQYGDDEYITLQEMFFSKKDLQDPETLNKIAKNIKMQKDIGEGLDNVVAVMGLISPIIIGILTNSILLGIGLFVPILIGIAFFLNNVSEKRNIRLKDKETKNLFKLRDQCEKLKNKAQSTKSKDADIVVKNCDKVLKAINDLFDAQKAEYEKKEKESDMLPLTQLQDFIDNPKTMGDGYDSNGMFYYYKLYGFSKLASHIAKNKKNFDLVDISNDIYGNNVTNEEAKKVIDKNSSYARQIYYNDDYGIILGEKDNKLYYYEFGAPNNVFASFDTKEADIQSKHLDYDKHDLMELAKKYNIKL